MQRIDLHTHSDRSDGTDSPEDLVRNVAAAGLDVFALCDHDSTAGWSLVQDAAERAGVQVVLGTEISTTLGGRSVHLLGYDFDPQDAGLIAEFERVIEGRNSRLPRIVAALNNLGIPITAEQVYARSANAAATGRPHVADVLIDMGVVASRDEAFATYLTSGKPAYVERYGVDLRTAVELVRAAGGKSVVAHPWARNSASVLTAELFAELASIGLDGIEVDHNDHDAQARAILADIATSLGLAKTGGSDYHGTGKSSAFSLGCNTTAPEEFEKLFA